MGDKKFSLFHLSLLPVPQLDFSTLSMTREGWLRHVFSRSFTVEYRSGHNLVWVPQNSEFSEHTIIGIIQRQKPHSLHRAPEEGGEEYISMEWQGAYALIDPTEHDIGQRIAIENDVVGLPSALLASLVSTMNTRHERPFNIEFDAVFDGRSFWQFAALHNYLLEWIRFDFSAPNMWGAKADLDRELQQTRDETGAERVKIELRSRVGIRAQSKKVIEAVEYAEKGAGDLNSRSLDGKRYSSKRKQKRSSVVSPLDDSLDKTSYFARMWRRILGGESANVSGKENDSLGDDSLPHTGPADGE
jgi:hypothetical protein